MVETEEIELSSLGNNPEINGVEDKHIDVKPCSLNTLFFKFASRKEKCLLFLGFIFAIISGALGPLSYTFYGPILDEVNSQDVDLSRLVLLLLGITLFLLGSAVFAFLERLSLGYFAENVTRHYRDSYVDAILHHDVVFLERFSPGRLGQRFSEESSRIVDGLGPGLGNLVRALSSLFCGIIIGFAYDWMLTFLSLVVSPFIVYFSFKFNGTYGEYNELIMKEHQSADSLAEESFRDIKTVIGLGAEEKFINRYYKVIRDCCKQAVRCTFRSSSFHSGMDLATQLANAFVYMSAVLLIHYQRVDYPTLLYENNCTELIGNSVEICFQNITSLSNTCQSICNQVDTCWFDENGGSCLIGGEVMIVMMAVLQGFPGIGTAFTSLVYLAKSRMSAAYFLEVIEHTNRIQSGKDCPSSSGGDIVYKNVDFAYASRDVQVLRQLNLTIHENEMLGIVGESGSGKSTILKLLLQLYLPTNGSITWNGKDVSTLSIPWIRDQISYVAQEPVLFSGTIRENLMYGRVGCTEEEMVEAAKLVEADAFIRSFPKGYDTYVGELGTSLSGGQKQRIAIARAMIRRPRILVLDEATSALDSQSEKIVQNAMEIIRERNKAEGKGLSIVIVAHRLSSIRSCDRIVVVDEGHVVEEGKHEELLAKDGIYTGLYKSQETESEESTKESEILEQEKGEKGEEEKKKQSVVEQPVKIDEAVEENAEREQKDSGDPQKAKEKNVSMTRLLQFSPKHKWLFWTSFIGNIARAAFPTVYSYCAAVIQRLFYVYDMETLWREGWIFIYILFGIGILNGLGTLYQRCSEGIAGENLITSIRGEVYKKYIYMPLAFFDDPKHLPSILTSQLSIDGRRVRDLIDQLGIIFENYLLIFISIGTCLTPSGDWRLTLVAICMSPFLLAVEYLQWMVATKVTDQIDQELVGCSGVLTDYILNIHTVHAYNLQDTLLHEMMDRLKPTNQKTVVRYWRKAVGQGLSVFMPCVYNVVVLFVSFQMLIRGQIDFVRMFFVFMTISTCASTAGINMAYTVVTELAQKSTNHIVATIEMKNENDDARALKAQGTDGEIQFNHVSFVYPTRPDSKVLRDISFTIPKGSSVAFVGPSGCGKSTIISLIQRMYKPEKGEVLMNGCNVETVNLDSYRSLLGAVNQEPCLFSGTIRENLLMGVNREVSESELEEVCRQALCMDFINEMPDRFDTDLGTTGKSVSGGQKQRLALARAILRNPHILLLDEATSALDSENQDKFLEALDQWRSTHPCTVVTVAHRLSTIVDSDTIFVVHDGIIIASGTHEELVHSCEFYADLVRGQMDGE